MSKYCGNCGAQWDDNVKVCGNCGSPFDDVKPASKAPKIIKMCIICAIIIAAALIGWSVASNYIGAKGTVNKAINAYKADSVDQLASLASNVFYYSDDSDYVDEYFESQLDNTIQKFENNVGHNYKISYNIEEIYKMNDRQYNNKLDQVAILYDEFDVASIEEIQVAKVKLTAKQGKRHVDETLTMTLTKEGGAWRLLEVY